MHKHLLQLLAENRQAPARRPLTLRALADDEAELFLYDFIVDSVAEAEWWGGIAPEPFIAKLQEVTASTLHLRINSPGGSVFAARAMETALREFNGRVITHVDGLAASAATLLAEVGAERIIGKGSMFMIHKAWTWLAGNEDDCLKTAALLGKTDQQLAETYADRTGQPVQQLLDWMRAETWFTGREAVDAGFSDRLAEEAQPAAQAAGGWSLKAYNHAPQLAALPAPAPQAPPQPSAPPKADVAALLRRLSAAALPA